MKILVTGGCGFLGSNLVLEALERGHEVCVVDNLSRIGSDENLRWLRGRGLSRFVHCDVRSSGDVERTVSMFSPERVFHMAGQVAMTTSLENPRHDFEVNALGTLNVLEALRRHAPHAGLIYSSTNKVYGDFANIEFKIVGERYVAPSFPNGFDEAMPLDFQSPYGCSKGAAEQYVRDYARMFGLKAIVFRHSSMYGGRQFATVDQGWIGWFCRQALETLRDPDHVFTINGDGYQVRDLLHAEDMKSLYFAASERISDVSGEIFNVGGGMSNSLSLRELFKRLEKCLGVNLRYEPLPVRLSDQKIFVADIRRAEKHLDWWPRVGVEEGLKAMLMWVAAGLNIALEIEGNGPQQSEG